MRITTAFLAVSIPLVMMELSNAVKPIKPTSFSTPVLINQTKSGLRSNTFKKIAFGHLVQEYEYSNAPVYRRGYALYRYFIVLRNDRAARITKEELKLLDDDGNLCLGESSEMKMLEDGIDDNLVKFTYSLSIDHGWAMAWPTKIDGTINLNDPNTKFFAVTTRAQYSSPIVAGTTCTQIETTIKAAMVEIVHDWKPKVTTQRPKTQPKPTSKPPKGGCKAGSQTE